MLDNLTDKFNDIIKNINGKGKITEDNVKEITREIRLTLLDADVNFKVVKEFVNNVKDKALGQDVIKSLNPSEVFLKILKDELLNLLGTEESNLNLNEKKTRILLSGLQGSGKTTTAGKLALYLRKKESKKPLLVACDIYRPGAIDQLKQVGKELGIEVFDDGLSDPSSTVVKALEYADENNFDTVIVDTAGRLHIDDKLMDELDEITKVLQPTDTLLVIDALTGQDAINVIETFNRRLKLTGSILTKMDSDTKGGVALSLRHITNIPIIFLGVSEKMDGLDKFHPTRITDRILGMGDVASLIEKVESTIDVSEAEKLEKQMKKGKFDLEDFLSQLKQIKKMGPLENIIKMIPGAKKMGLSNVSIDPKELAHIEAIIKSMTQEERKNPKILKANRKKRIASGSGRTVEEVNSLLKRHEMMQEMMKKLKNGNLKFPF